MRGHRPVSPDRATGQGEVRGQARVGKMPPLPLGAWVGRVSGFSWVNLPFSSANWVGSEPKLQGARTMAVWSESEVQASPLEFTWNLPLPLSSGLQPVLSRSSLGPWARSPG